MRGKQGSAGNKGAVHGITPAGAGKTYCLFSSFWLCRDHPRRCGENPVSEVLEPPFLGSPPQVRGKPKITRINNTRDRITPAGAGKTAITYGGIAVATDHPRRCGENRRKTSRERRRSGSPPQVRGKHTFHLRLSLQAGITPAGAGKTRMQADAG